MHDALGGHDRRRVVGRGDARGRAGALGGAQDGGGSGADVDEGRDAVRFPFPPPACGCSMLTSTERTRSKRPRIKSSGSRRFWRREQTGRTRESDRTTMMRGPSESAASDGSGPFTFTTGERDAPREGVISTRYYAVLLLYLTRDALCT